MPLGRARPLRTGPRRSGARGRRRWLSGRAACCWCSCRLLASADAAFAQVVDAVTPDDRRRLRRALVFLFVFGAAAAAGACFLLVAPPR